MLPPKAKITPEVCSGRKRPKLNHGSMLSSGKASCNAITSPTSMPTTAQNTVAITPQRTGSSSYFDGSAGIRSTPRAIAS